MKTSLRRFVLVGLSVALVSGCKKKEEATADVSREAENNLPVAEQSASKDTASAASPGEAPAPGSPDAPVVAAAPSTTEQAAYEVWFKKNNLDLNDPKMLDADPDEDGFSNRDEFLADTDPHDKNSRPGIHKAMRLKEYNEVRLPLVLESIEGDKARIRRTDQDSGKPVTVKAGDSIKGLPLKVKSVEAKEDFDKAGDKIDVSRVALEDPSTKETVILMKDLPARTAASYAVIISPDGKTSLKIHKGDTFSWPPEPGVTYRVLDLSQDQAVLQQVETRKTLTIPRQ